VAAEFDNDYFVTSIKLMVYPSNDCFGISKETKYRKSSEFGPLDGYATPVVFTCNGRC
jgi:hypothetical protein